MTLTDIINETRRFTKTNTVSYTTDDIISSSNRALDHVFGLIRQAEGRWQLDDSNNTDLPFYLTSLSSGIGDISLDPSMYRIERVEIRNQNGGWTKLRPYDVQDPSCASYTDLRTQTGTPVMYDKVGNSLILAPAPSFSDTIGTPATWSLRVYAERGPYYLSSSNLGQTLGFNPMFHRLVSWWAAYDYAIINDEGLLKTIRPEITNMEQELKTFYSFRGQDEKKKLTVRHSNFR